MSKVFEALIKVRNERNIHVIFFSYFPMTHIMPLLLNNVPMYLPAVQTLSLWMAANQKKVDLIFQIEKEQRSWISVYEKTWMQEAALKYSEFILPVEIKQSSIYLKYKVQKQLVIGDCISLFTAKFYVTRWRCRWSVLL